jgi:Fe-S-cluster containining protein
MSDTVEAGPLAFFKALHDAFGETLRIRAGKPELIEALLSQAFDSFEGNTAIQSEGLPDVACQKGCALCCVLRVTATAPEVLLIDRYIRVRSDALARVGIGLAERIAEAAAPGPERRRARGNRCPFTAKGICVIYLVRPFACRGHASYDKRACADALRGRARDVPISAPHAMVQSIVQNAMQSALRDAGYDWRSYELYPALQIALKNRASYANWAAGRDVFAPALAADVSVEEMAKTFDAINATPD